MHYLVRHGSPGFLGRFVLPKGKPAELIVRSTPVVIKSRRGLELGEFLGPVETAFDDPFLGELLRPASQEDLDQAQQQADRGNEVFQDAVRIAESLGLPIQVVDFELLLDGRHGILHVVRAEPCDFLPLLTELAEAQDVIILIFDLTAEPEDVHSESHGCGSCGEGGCSSGGCGENGCGTCSAGGGAELASYFAELRSQMERGRLPLA